MKLLDLFMKINTIHNEQVLKKLIEVASPVLNITWRPVDNNKGNYRTALGGHGNPVGDFAENIPNSIDAITEALCRLEGISPTSPNAPLTPRDAVQLCLGFKNGDFTHLIGNRPGIREAQAELVRYIQILAEGDRDDPPLLTISDCGIGQHPDDFETTFLTYQGENKLNKKFQLGRFNHGGSGAIRHCGKLGYKLIISRRHPKIAAEDGYKSSPIGFTLIRKHPLSAEEREAFKSGWVEYMLVDGKIPTIDPIEFEIGCSEFQNRQKLPERRIFTHGTVVKLFNYKLPKGSRSNIVKGGDPKAFWNLLNHSLPKPVLPYLLQERRDYVFTRNNNSVGEHERDIFGWGNLNRLHANPKNLSLLTFPYTVQKEGLGKLTITVFVVGLNVPERTLKYLISKNSISLLLGGQTHGGKDRRWLRSKLGLPSLADNMLIYVNLDEVLPEFLDQVIKSGRGETTEDTDEIEELYDFVADLLKKDKSLQTLETKFRMDKIENSEKVDIQKLLKDLNKNRSFPAMLKKLLAATKTDIPGILSAFVDAPPIKPATPVITPTPTKTNYFPTFLTPKLPMDDSGIFHKGITIDSNPETRKIGGLITFLTDAENGYLNRVEDKGEFSLEVLEFGNEIQPDIRQQKPLPELFDVVQQDVVDGTINIRLTPHKKLIVGDFVHLRASLTAGNDLLTTELTVNILNYTEKEPGTSPRPKKKEYKKPPELIRVSAADKARHKWDENPQGVVKVVPTIEGDSLDLIYLNMTSTLFQAALKVFNANTGPKLQLMTKQYELFAFFNTAAIYSSFYRQQQECQKRDEPAPDPVDATARMMQDCLIPGLIAINTLPSLNVFDNALDASLAPSINQETPTQVGELNVLIEDPTEEQPELVPQN